LCADRAARQPNGLSAQSGHQLCGGNGAPHRHGDAQLAVSLQRSLGTYQRKPDQLAVAVEANRMALRRLVVIDDWSEELELENTGFALFLRARLEQSEGDRLTAGAFLREIGMPEFTEGLVASE
jgi:hypothetical protein